MAKFFKTFANGILYIIMLPFLVAILALSAVVSLVAFIFIGLKAIILFFKGENMFGELPEDVEAKTRLEAMVRAAQGQPSQPQQPISQGNTIIIQNLNAVIAPRKEKKESDAFFFENEDLSAIEETLSGVNLLEGKPISQIEQIEETSIIDALPIKEETIEPMSEVNTENKSRFLKVERVEESKKEIEDLDITYDRNRKGRR
ncbi:MAG: hypothetical protein RBR85_02920 [Bacilli bacterium]|jgi:hypothetical protein|nr:hypothetical protein [Bacilli bacterium]